MRRASFAIICVLFAAACEQAPPEPTLKEIPAVFVGEWDISLADCGAGGPLAVSVGPQDVRFPDSRIEVTGVAPDGADAARVDGHFTSADTSWDGNVRLEVSDDGRIMNVVNGSPVTPRVRCP